MILSLGMMPDVRMVAQPWPWLLGLDLGFDLDIDIDLVDLTLDLNLNLDLDDGLLISWSAIVWWST